MNIICFHTYVTRSFTNDHECSELSIQRSMFGFTLLRGTPTYLQTVCANKTLCRVVGTNSTHFVEVLSQK